MKPIAMNTIRQLSQEVGIGTDTLRAWERRYGFPKPKRDARGHRLYPTSQVEELRIICMLQNLGFRPGRIFALSPAERRQLLDRERPGATPQNDFMQQLIREMPPEEIDQELRSHLQEMGPRAFVHQLAVPLLQGMDHGWTEGSLSVAREHILSDCLEQVLKEQLAQSNPVANPRIVFLTLSGERHKLGLLLAALLFHLEGLNCFIVQEELPLSEVPQLVHDVKAVAVALSFSAHYPSRQAKQNLAQLRNILNPEIKLFAGGHAVRKGIAMSNLNICPDLRKIPELCRKYFHLSGA